MYRPHNFIAGSIFYVSRNAVKYKKDTSKMIVISLVYYTIPFGFSLFRHFWDITFHPL